MPVEIGQPAPEFELANHHGETIRLTDFAGSQGVALVFYPFAFSGLCTGELCEIRDNLEVFTSDGVHVAAISCDPVFSLRAFADAEGYEFDLLSDFWPHGAVAQIYGVFDGTRGRAERATFLIDKTGVLRWSIVNHPGQPRPIAAYREALANL